MALDSPVGRLELIDPGGADQDRGHHGQGSEAGGHHVAHDIAVIVFEGPEEAALRPDHAGDRVVDQGIEILDPRLLEGILVLLVVELLEDLLEAGVIGLGDRVLGGEPEVYLLVKGIGKAGAGKALDRGVCVVDALDDAGALELMDGPAGLLPALIRKDQFGPAGALDAVLHILVNIPVGVTGEDDRLFPGPDIGFDPAAQDGSAEDRAVQGSADGPVGALVHIVEPVLLDAGGIGSDRSAFDSYAQPLCRFGSLDRDPVAGLISLFQSQIIIFRLQLDKGQKQVVFDHLPDDPGHLISVHLDKRGGHGYFLHRVTLLP